MGSNDCSIERLRQGAGEGKIFGAASRKRVRLTGLAERRLCHVFSGVVREDTGQLTVIDTENTIELSEVMSMDPYGPPRKRPRSDAPANGNGNGHAASGPNETECRRFNTPEGCPYGDACRFRHVPASSVSSTMSAAVSAAAPLPPGEFR